MRRLEHRVGGVEAPQLVQGDAGVVEQHRLARLGLERVDRRRWRRPGSGAWPGVRRRVARGGEALLDQAHAGVVARLRIGVLAGAGEQRLVAVEVVGAQVRARLGAEPVAECATGLGGAGVCRATPAGVPEASAGVDMPVRRRAIRGNHLPRGEASGFIGRGSERLSGGGGGGGGGGGLGRGAAAAAVVRRGAAAADGRRAPRGANNSRTRPAARGRMLIRSGMATIAAHSARARCRLCGLSGRPTSRRLRVEQVRPGERLRHRGPQRLAGRRRRGRARRAPRPARDRGARARRPRARPR